MPRKTAVKKAVDREENSHKNPAAVALGRLGGKAPKSKPYGFQTVPKKRLKQLSALGVAARKKLKRAS